MAEKSYSFIRNLFPYIGMCIYSSCVYSSKVVTTCFNHVRARSLSVVSRHIFDLLPQLSLSLIEIRETISAVKTLSDLLSATLFASGFIFGWARCIFPFVQMHFAAQAKKSGRAVRDEDEIRRSGAGSNICVCARVFAH